MARFDPRAFWWATPTPMFHWFTLTPRRQRRRKDTSEKLQQLIDRLEQCKRDAYVNWDFGRQDHKGAFCGIYAELALGWSDDEGFANVGELVAHLKSCIGKQFTGYRAANTS